MREWKTIRDFKEILFEEYNGIAKITINRPQYRNAFTPKTTWELSQAFAMCREMQDINVVLLTGAMSEVPDPAAVRESGKPGSTLPHDGSRNLARYRRQGGRVHRDGGYRRNGERNCEVPQGEEPEHLCHRY